MKLFVTVLKKELTVEWRSKEVILTSTFFAFLLATTFMFGFFEGERIQSGANAGVYAKIGPGILWIGLMFAATIVFTRSFAREQQARCIEALRLVPGIHTPLFLGKCAANIVFLFVVELILVPSVALFFAIPLAQIWAHLLLLLSLGTIGLVMVGTLLSAVLASIRLRAVLMPLVLFPLVLPILIGAVSATEALVRESMHEFWDWTFLMLAFDVVFAVLSNWLFRPVLEASE